MRTRKHGNGLSRKQIIEFSSRLAYQGLDRNNENAYLRGWADACNYYAHVLRTTLRETEKFQNQLNNDKNYEVQQ